MTDGRIVIPTTSAEIAQDFLDDIELEAIKIGIASPPIQRGTDWWLLGQAVSKLALITFAIAKQAETNASILTATGAALEQLRIAYGLPAVVSKVATGRIRVGIQSGSRTILDGEPLTGSNNVRYEALGTWTGVTDGTEIDVTAVDGGTQGNLKAGETVKFDSPPLGVLTDATVSLSVPITGGEDDETDEDKRARLLDRLQNTPAGGNSGHIIEIADAAVGNLSGVYVYPALGGPSSAVVVPVKKLDPDNNNFSRVLDSAALTLVRQAVQAELPTQNEIVVKAAVDEPTSVSLAVDIPDSALAGGDGTGWVDGTPFPALTAGSGDGYDYTSVTAVPSSSQIIISAQVATNAVAGQTSIAWWSTNDQRFRTYLVTAAAGVQGAWDLTLDRPLLDSDNNPVAIGDYICPAATNIEAYGETWRGVMGSLGPGENTTAAARLPRAQRFPSVDDAEQSDLNTQLLVQFAGARDDDDNLLHPEIRNVAYQDRTTSAATVPADVDTAPNVLTLDNFGIYPEL
jgi:uncharacterized phage protein gp47/JayE